VGGEGFEGGFKEAEEAVEFSGGGLGFLASGGLILRVLGGKGIAGGIEEAEEVGEDGLVGLGVGEGLVELFVEFGGEVSDFSGHRTIGVRS
jgi:hypothetical protein